MVISFQENWDVAGTFYCYVIRKTAKLLTLSLTFKSCPRKLIFFFFWQFIECENLRSANIYFEKVSN